MRLQVQEYGSSLCNISATFWINSSVIIGLTDKGRGLKNIISALGVLELTMFNEQSLIG